MQFKKDPEALKAAGKPTKKRPVKRTSKPGVPKVSDHAIVRYFERVLGLDIKNIEQEILSVPVVEMITKLGGTGKFPCKNFTLILKDYVVVTII